MVSRATRTVQANACPRAASRAALTRAAASRRDRVDRLWSVTPIFYTAHFAHASDWAPRPTLMAGLALVWGLRLSWNFARKAGYQVGEEDYRWPELQRMMKAFAPSLFPVLWQLFNVTFICLYQHVLLLLIVLPSWVAQQSSEPLGALDYAAAALFSALLLLETVADQQQWVFQQSKRKLLPQKCVLASRRCGVWPCFLHCQCMHACGVRADLAASLRRAGRS